jgi:hypothetical protein
MKSIKTVSHLKLIIHSQVVRRLEKAYTPNIKLQIFFSYVRVSHRSSTDQIGVKNKTELLLLFIFSGSEAQRGLWPPLPRGFLITHNDAPQSVGLLWTSDQLVAETST